MKSKANVSIVVGVAVPVLMILFVAGSIYLPGLFIKPTVNFVYVVGNNDRYYCKLHYDVVNRKLVKQPGEYIKDTPNSTQDCEARFYQYDVTTNDSKELTFEEASKLTLDPSQYSSDGFEVVRGGGGGDFFLFDVGRDYNSIYIRGHNVSRKIQLRTPSADSPYSYPEYSFLGWLVP